MKTKQFIFSILMLLAGQAIKAQECIGFLPYEPDTEFEMTYYDKKGKVTSKNYTKVNDITEMDGIVQAELSSSVSDKNEEELNTVDFEVICKENGYEIDILNMLNPALVKSTYGMELEIEGDALVFPKELSVGKTLEDASTEIKVSSNDIKLMTIRFDISNRNIEAKETISTSAGTYDCYKLSYEFNSKVAFVKKKYKIIQWIADGVGVVREEMYNKKGKLESYSELTVFKKP